MIYQDYHCRYYYDPGAELGASSMNRQFTTELLLPPVSHSLFRLPRDASVLRVIKRIMYSVKKCLSQALTLRS